jgi:hypothetical protein
MKMHYYYFGIDRSHCGSCWERSDEELHLIITNLEEQNIKEKFEKFCWDELTFDEELSIPKFMRWLNTNSGEDYLSTYMELSGTSYCPNISYKGSYGSENDMATLINPEILLGDLWNYFKEMMKKNKSDRIERERKSKEEREKREKEEREYKQKLEEYNSYIKMKEKWDGLEKPKKSKKPKKTKFEKILENFRKNVNKS